MDGCTPFNLPDDSCKRDIVGNVFNGTEREFIDNDLQPYSGEQNSCSSSVVIQSYKSHRLIILLSLSSESLKVLAPFLEGSIVFAMSVYSRVLKIPLCS